ncbi:MAG: type I restriction enzyme HsdR N-terminal domain-containing protein [Chloroflexi bacterium]|nr:type I restriction enzyme HsdR N-terminal domain-containing protein [Chloroflexota bacterium]
MASTSKGLDLVDRLQRLARRVQRHLESVQTEEATKTALVLPFIADVLGYDIYDPTEVVPEFTADVGTKRGEKVDYAILRYGRPILLIECKRYGADLGDSAKSQLHRYFSVTESRVGVLTDGVTYRFFSDVDAPNKMDDRPFYEFDLRSADEAEAKEKAKEISRFTKSSFDADALQGQAQDLKYTREILSLIKHEFDDPSPDFVRLFSKRVYPRTHTKRVVAQFTEITKRALRQFLSNHLKAQITRVLEGDQADEASSGAGSGQDADAAPAVADPIHTTTEDEWQGFFAVKAILSRDLSPERIHMRDVKSYCGILLDNTNRQPICRLHFNNPANKFLALIGDDKKRRLVSIESVDDIFQYADEIRVAANRYLPANEKFIAEPAEA